jgi:hypothetical protein
LGKRTLGHEFARYSSAPGRFFSCCAAVVELDGNDVLSIACAIAKKLSRLAHQHLGDAPLEQSDLRNKEPCRSVPEMVMQIIGILERLDRFRRRAVLVVINDRSGVLSVNEEARAFLGSLVERTERSHFLVCSPEPIHGLLGPRIAKNFAICSLSRIDAARLFLKCLQRHLLPADFPGGRSPPSGFSELAAVLGEHPLLVELDGNPRRICEVATELVVPAGPSLMDIATELSIGSLPTPLRTQN